MRLEESEGGLVATALPTQSSGVLSGLGSGAGLLVGPADVDELPAGRRYPVIVLAADAFARAEAPF